MKRLFLFTLAAACCLVLSRGARAQQIDAYTSMEYDEVTNTVEAYSETAIDFDLMESYNVLVSLRVTGDDGTTPVLQTRTSNGQPYISVTAFFQGAAGVTYTARGTHKALARLNEQEQFYPYKIVFYDPWWYGFFGSQVIDSPWFYNFLNQGYLADRKRDSSIMNLGTTYDYATVAVPAGPKATMSAAQTVKDGNTAQFSLTIENGTALSYAWLAKWPSGAGNSPRATFDPASGSPTTVTAKWFAFPNQPCPPPNASPADPYYNAKYTIKCAVTFSGGKKTTAESNLTVDAYWNPAGSVAPTEITGGPEHGFDNTRRLWVVTGPGTLARVTHQAVINVPASSQFYNKVRTHEEKHVEQWATGMLSDLLQIPDLMAQLSPLTDATEAGLLAKINATAQTWFDSQRDIYRNRLPAAEKEAYAVSDSLSPQYIYQNCGRF
jgi:hypothetical protein